jgi:RNase H-like domain found in reverse transcriptase
VETLKVFRDILLGQKIIVHTDHENLTYQNFNSDRVMRWRLYIEEYSPDLQYIKGTQNVVANALSRLEINETPFENTEAKFLGYGLLPPKEAEATPWDKLCVDLIGPYTIQRKGQQDLICRCVTMIDPATGWFEIQQYDDKQSITVANIIEKDWFSRYPWPTQVTFDRGSKFIGQDFQKMIKEDYGVKANLLQSETHRQTPLLKVYTKLLETLSVPLS